MTKYDIGIKGEDFFGINGTLKSNYNNYDTLRFINYNETSPIINIFKVVGNKYYLNASSGYITTKSHPLFTDYSKCAGCYLFSLQP